MAIRSGFFNSVNGDRLYNAEFFANYFSSFIGNGVFPNPSTNLQIIANDDMTVSVEIGKCWINGYIALNDSDYTLNIDAADGVLNRIDRVVMRYDAIEREIKALVKKGETASAPTAQTLQRDADAFELGLADIYVGKGAIGITQSNITDLRLSTELCGIVHGLVDQVDTETLFNQYESWMLDKQNDMNDWAYSTKAMFEEDFNIWFATIQGLLNESVAGNLLNEISKIDAKTLQNRAEISDVKLKLSEQNIINFLNKTGIGFYDLFENLNYIDDMLTTANVDVTENNVKFINTKLLKMKEQSFDEFNNLELNIYDSERIAISAMGSSIDNKLKVLVTPGSIVAGDKFYHNGTAYTVSSIAEGI